MEENIQSQIATILDQSQYPDSGLSPAGQATYLKRYSFGALVLNFFYYFSMGDTLFAWLSAGASIIFAPLLVILPLFARQRAYTSRRWTSFNEFYAVQKRWDRWGLYLLIITLLIVGLVLWLVGPTILNATRSITGDSGSYVEQLQQTEQQYRDLLGQ